MAGLEGNVYQLGGLYTFCYHNGMPADWGQWAHEAAQIAIEEMNSGFLQGCKLELHPDHVRDYHCWPEDGEAAARALLDRGLLAIVGADCSGAAVRIAQACAAARTPVVSYGANASSLSSPDVFPYFIRNVVPSEQYDRHLVQVAAWEGVGRAGLLYTTDEWGTGAAEAVRKQAEAMGMEIAAAAGYPRDTSVPEAMAILAVMAAKGIRAFFILMPTPDTRIVFQAIARLGLNQVGYAFYASEMLSEGELPEIIQGARGYYAPISALEPSERLEAFYSRLAKRLGQAPGRASKAFLYAALSYDSLFLIGHAINLAHQQLVGGDAGNGTAWEVAAASLSGESGNAGAADNARSASGSARGLTGELLMRCLRRVSFHGLTGSHAFSAQSNDRYSMPLHMMNLHAGRSGKDYRYVVAGKMDSRTGKLEMAEGNIRRPGRS